MGLRGNRELKERLSSAGPRASFGPYWEPPFAGGRRGPPARLRQPQYRPVARCIEATNPLHAEEFPQGVIVSSTLGRQTLKIVNADEREST
jgi:hypothetical protein